MFDIRYLIRFDGLAGLCVGVVVLALASWLADLYQLPPWLIIANGLANLAYGSYSTALASRQHRPLFLICVLACANIFWSVVCVCVVVAVFQTASIFGIGHFAFEALFVGSLGIVEWRYRQQLTNC